MLWFVTPRIGFSCTRLSVSCWFHSGQVFFAVFFSFNFLLELLLSKNRWAFIMSILGIVDLVTIVPVFVALAVDPLVKSPTGFVRFYRVLTLTRVRSGACVEFAVMRSNTTRNTERLRSRLMTVAVVGNGNIHEDCCQAHKYLRVQ